MTKQKIGELLRGAGRILGYMVGFGFVGFMFIPTLMDASPLLRIPLIGGLIVAAGILMFTDASYRGARDCTMSDTLDRLEKKGEYKPTLEEEAKRYSRMKGILTAALAALIPFACAAFVAITAQPYAYTLQDYPSWLGALTRRPEIGEALVYMEGTVASAGFGDYMRVVVRFLLFPYIGLAGTLSDDMSLLFDRLSPLFMLILPAVAAIGYQFGPRRRAKEAKAIKEAKNTPRKRLKKNRGQTGPKEKKQLV